MKKYQLKLVGPFGLFHLDGRRIEVPSKKATALLALLATSPSGERARRWLQTMLWGGRFEEQAQNSLRREVSTLARVLADAEANDILIRSNQRIGLAIDLIDIDIDRLGASSAEAAWLKNNQFLEGLDLRDCDEFEDWLRDERERVREMLDIPLTGPPAVLPSAQEILGTALPSASEILGNTVPRAPPKPSVAVLPFAVLHDHPHDRLMGIALADEIGVILSQYPQLFIVASAAARALAHDNLANTQIARELGVRYLVDGTIMRVGERVRVSAGLIDGATGEQVWAETFSGSLPDLFELQTQVAANIAPQIWSKVDASERRRVLRLNSTATGDYEAYWRANALFRNWERDAILEAIELAESLVARDATCAWATSLAAYCHSVAYLMNFGDRTLSLRRSRAHYQAALRFGEDNVEALGYCAGTLINIGGDLQTADHIVGRALELMPTHQPALFWGGWVDVFNGRGDRGRERFELALRVNPASGARAQTLCGIGYAYLQTGNATTAQAFFTKACDIDPVFFLSYFGLQAAATMTGDEKTAREAAAQYHARRPEGFDAAQLFRHRLGAVPAPDTRSAA